MKILIMSPLAQTSPCQMVGVLSLPDPIGEMTSSIETSAEISLLTCPSTGLADMIGSAESEILLSLQYLEMDWYWGWQNQPTTRCARRCTARRFHRLIMNAHTLTKIEVEILLKSSTKIGVQCTDMMSKRF